MSEGCRPERFHHCYIINKGYTSVVTLNEKAILSIDWGEGLEPWPLEAMGYCQLSNLVLHIVQGTLLSFSEGQLQAGGSQLFSIFIITVKFTHILVSIHTWNTFFADPAYIATVSLFTIPSTTVTPTHILIYCAPVNIHLYNRYKEYLASIWELNNNPVNRTGALTNWASEISVSLGTAL